MPHGGNKCLAVSVESVLDKLVPFSSVHSLDTSFYSCGVYSYPSCGWPGFALESSPLPTAGHISVLEGGGNLGQEARG